MTITRDELEKKYNEYYRRKPNKWASDERNEFAFDVLSNYFDCDAACNIADLGCGNGHTLQYFAERWPQAKYYGIDLSTEAVMLARKRVPEAQIQNGFLGDVEPPKKFDAVILLGVCEHFEELDKTLQYLKPWVSDAGVFYVEIPNCIGYPTSSPEEGFRMLNTGSHQYEWHLYRDTWERIFTENGFDIVAKLTGKKQQYEFVWLLKVVKDERNG